MPTLSGAAGVNCAGVGLSRNVRTLTVSITLRVWIIEPMQRKIYV